MSTSFSYIKLRKIFINEHPHASTRLKNLRLSIKVKSNKKKRARHRKHKRTTSSSWRARAHVLAERRSLALQKKKHAKLWKSRSKSRAARFYCMRARARGRIEQNSLLLFKSSCSIFFFFAIRLVVKSGFVYSFVLLTRKNASFAVRSRCARCARSSLFCGCHRRVSMTFLARVRFFCSSLAPTSQFFVNKSCSTRTLFFL